MSLVLLAQSSVDPSNDPPANAWMQKASPYLDQNSRDSNPLRKQRDTFWQNSLAASHFVLTAETAPFSSVSEGTYNEHAPEIPAFADRRVVIATFLNAESIMTPDRKCIYTEAHFRVTEILEGKEFELGKTIVVSVAGGTVKDSNGKDISYLTSPRRYFIQPSRTYLLLLTAEPLGNFYRMGKSWDLTDGIVRPNSFRDDELFKEGRSAIDGKTQDEVVAILRRLLASGSPIPANKFPRPAASHALPAPKQTTGAAPESPPAQTN